MTASRPSLGRRATASKRWLLAMSLLLGGCFDSEEERAAGLASSDDATPSTSRPGGFTRQEITVVATGRAHGGEAPLIVVTVDGREIGRSFVVAEAAAGKRDAHTFVHEGAPATRLAIRYANDRGERDLWIHEVTLDGVELPLDRAVYARDGREDLPGRKRLSWAGELRFEDLAHDRAVTSFEP